MRKGISFGTADMGAKINSFKVTQKIVPGDAYHAATCLMQAMLQDKLGPADQHKGHDVKSCPPIFDHALERLSIQVVCNVKLLQNLHIECAQVHYMLMHVEGPDVTHVKYFLFAQWRLFELPAVLPTYSRHTCCATTKSAVLM